MEKGSPTKLAVSSRRKGILVKEEFIKALQSGVNLANEDKFDEAVSKLEPLADLHQSMVQALIQRGRCHWEMRRWDKATEDFRKAGLMAPDNIDVKWTMSLMNLQQGNFIEGWKTFDDRWESKKFDSPRLKTKKPRWRKGSGYKDVLVWSEQGIGDQILYCSLLREIKSETPVVTAMVDARLIPLFERSMPGIDFIPQNAFVSDIDAQIPMGSLVSEFIESKDDIARIRSDAFLIADYARASEIRSGLNLSEGERLVGLSWISGAPRIGNHKSVALEDMLPILQIPNVRFVSLQYGDHYQDIYELEKKHGIRIEVVPEVDNTTDIDGLAALITACDCVVSVSNVTGHISGAVGTPTFLLDSNKLWYWNNTRGNRNLWYPCVKTYRKSYATAPWTTQVADIAEDLKRHLVPGHRPTFVFFRTGTEEQIWHTRIFVKSLRETNPDARIIMCTDSKTPVIDGTERFELDSDSTDFMEYRLRIYAALGLDYPAMYLDDDMVVYSEIFPDALLGDQEALFCERSFNRDAEFNPDIKGLHFSEHKGKTLYEVFPYLACATVTKDHTVWGELLGILDHIDPKYRKWYGDQEAMKIWSKMNKHGVLSEDRYACLPEHLGNKDPKIIHYKGNRKDKMKG